MKPKLNGPHKDPFESSTLPTRDVQGRKFSPSTVLLIFDAFSHHSDESTRAWMSLLEEVNLGYEIIDPEQVSGPLLARYRTIITPPRLGRTPDMNRRRFSELEQYARDGGTVVVMSPDPDAEGGEPTVFGCQFLRLLSTEHFSENVFLHIDTEHPITEGLVGKRIKCSSAPPFFVLCPEGARSLAVFIGGSKTEYGKALFILPLGKGWVVILNLDLEIIALGKDVLAKLLKSTVYLLPYNTPSPPAAVGTPFIIDQNSIQYTGGSVKGCYPKVAFDGTNYLVVWPRHTPGTGKPYNHRLIGARVTPAGVVLDKGGFVITQNFGKYNSFSLAFDGTNYLVAWEQDLLWPSNINIDPVSTIAAARVSPSGVVLDTTPIIIDDQPKPTGAQIEIGHHWPVVISIGSLFLVAYRTENLKLLYQLVGYITPEDGIFAKLVASDGTLLTGKTKLVGFNSQLKAFDRMGLVWTKTKNQGVLAFHAFDDSQNPTEYSVRMITIVGLPTSSPSGKKGFAVFPSSSGKIASYVKNEIVFDWPAISSDEAGGYLAIYEDVTGKPQTQKWPDIYGATIDLVNSQQISSPGPLAKGVSEDYCELAFDGKNYVIVFEHSIGCHSYVGAVKVTTSGVPSPITVLNSQADLATFSSVAFGTTNGLVAFENFNPPTAPGGTDGYTSVLGLIIDKTP